MSTTLDQLLINREQDKKEQTIEIEGIKKHQSELYKKCLKIEHEQNKLKSR